MMEPFFGLISKSKIRFVVLQVTNGITIMEPFLSHSINALDHLLSQGKKTKPSQRDRTSYWKQSFFFFFCFLCRIEEKEKENRLSMCAILVLGGIYKNPRNPYYIYFLGLPNHLSKYPCIPQLKFIRTGK